MAPVHLYMLDNMTVAEYICAKCEAGVNTNGNGLVSNVSNLINTFLVRTAAGYL